MIKDTKKKRAPRAVHAANDSDASRAQPGNGRATQRKKKRSEANEAVLQELMALRNSVDLMVERYAIRVNGQISELMQLIQGDGEVGQAPHGLTVKAASAILEEIRKADLKPKKGRGKDFARVQKLMTRLRALNPTTG